MIKFLGVEYSRGATAKIIDNAGPAKAPQTIKSMFPEHNWNIIKANTIDIEECKKDRFGDTFSIHKKIYKGTPTDKHIFIGGDHSVNFSHFAAISDQYPNEDICLVYFDAHLDIHTPESSKKEASFAPHGTNVRHLLGEGDYRWLSLCQKKPSLKPENLFYFGTRSFEPSEIQYVKNNNIFFKTPSELKLKNDWDIAINEVLNKIGQKKFIVSFDFDGIDGNIFKDVWVPEPNGLSLEFAEYFINKFKHALNFEFVEYAVSEDKNCYNIVKKLISLSI